MPKCSKVGCGKEATRHSKVAIDYGLFADVWGCDEHHDEIVRSLLPEEKEETTTNVE